MKDFDFDDSFMDEDNEDKLSDEEFNEIMAIKLEDDEENPIVEEKKPVDYESSTIKKRSNQKSLKKIGQILLVVIIICVVILGIGLYGTLEGPTITSIHIESDNEDNKEIANYKDKIILSFSVDKKLSKDPIVIINNRKVNVYHEGKDYYAKYYVDFQDDKDLVVEFSISDYKDLIQKTGKKVSKTTDNSSVTIPAYK